MATAKPNNLMGRVFAVSAAAIALYVVLLIATGWRDRSLEISTFPLVYVPLLIVFSLANYWLRFVRWEIYLRKLGISITRRESLSIFFATFVMVITPGKLGEVFKAGILWERHRVPLAVGLPVVIAERIFDFLAIFALAGMGLVFWSGPVSGIALGFIIACVLPLLLVGLRSSRARRWLISRAGKAPYLRRHRLALEESLESLSGLMVGRLAAGSLAISVVAWACECLSLWFVCVGCEASISITESFFIYAAGMLVGALAFLPGGLVGTEGTLIWLLVSRGIESGSAVTIALIVRLATLWLAVAIGMVVFLATRKIFWNDPPENHERE
ncbi:MAG: lysylphosphatidylglycerol synthase transmembrane domain-containing protein [bacterium]